MLNVNKKNQGMTYPSPTLPTEYDKDTCKNVIDKKVSGLFLLMFLLKKKISIMSLRIFDSVDILMFNYLYSYMSNYKSLLNSNTYNK